MEFIFNWAIRADGTYSLVHWGWWPIISTSFYAKTMCQDRALIPVVLLLHFEISLLLVLGSLLDESLI